MDTPGRDVYRSSGSPFQSFHTSVTRGGRLGLSLKAWSKTARLTSLAVRVAARSCWISAKRWRMNFCASSSEDPSAIA